jgi:hypothetical protein
MFEYHHSSPGTVFMVAVKVFFFLFLSSFSFNSCLPLVEEIEQLLGKQLLIG